MPIKFTKRLMVLAAIALLATACAGRAAPTSWPGITLDGDTAYVAYGQQMHALDVSSGQQRWAYPAEASNDVLLFAEPAVADDIIVTGGYKTGGGFLAQNSVTPVLALDRDGVPVWTVPFTASTDNIIGQSVVDGDRIYVPSADYHLYALNASNGALLWTFAGAKQAIWAAPVLADGTLYVASLDHFIYALEPDTGAVRWSTELGGAIAGAPTVWNGLLIVGTFDNTLNAVSMSNGAIVWSEPTQGWVWSGPLAVDDVLYFGDLAGYLYAADADTGRIRWQEKPGGPLRGTPALADGILYAAARDGFVYFRSAADGAKTGPGEVEIGGQLLSTPQVSGDLLIVGAYGAKDNQIVFALDRATGSMRWSFPPPQ